MLNSLVTAILLNLPQHWEVSNTVYMSGSTTLGGIQHCIYVGNYNTGRHPTLNIHVGKYNTGRHPTMYTCQEVPYWEASNTVYMSGSTTLGGIQHCIYMLESTTLGGINTAYTSGSLQYSLEILSVGGV